MRLFLRALGYLRPYRVRFVGALLLVGVSAVLELGRPWPLKITVDLVLSGEASSRGLGGLEGSALLALACLALLLLQLGSAGLALWQNHLSIGVGQRMVSDLRAEVVSHLHGLSLGFFDRRGASDLAYRVAFDSFAVQSLLLNGLFPLASAALLLLGMGAVMWSMNPVLAAVFLAAAPALLVLVGVFGERIERASARQREQESGFLAAAQQGVGAIQVVQAFNAEAREQARVMQASEGALRSALRSYLLQTGYSGAVNVLVAVASAAVLYVGGSMALRGQLSAGDLIVFVSYLATLFGPISSISQTAGLMRAASAGAQRVFELLDTEPEVRDAPDAVRLRDVRGELRFEAVSFRYPAGTLALEGVSFQAAPGQLVALVGRTGAGKTTLASLIPRFRDPSEGCVRLDGMDLRALRRRELRERIGVVPQSPLLFPATLAENIRYGRPEASQAELERAAELAGVAPFAEALPRGYDTPLGADGHALSQGQMQRVTLARALLRDPQLLILDEPTSALDAETEAFVMGGIERAMKGRTTFVIAHRLSTVRRADLVLVLESGRLIEAGRFEELRRAGGAFQRLCDAFFQDPERPGPPLAAAGGASAEVLRGS